MTRWLPHRYHDRVTFVDDVRRCADLSGPPLGRLDAGQDRYGPVAAILFAVPGWISVRLRNDGDYLVTVWTHSGNLVASGRTSSLEGVVTTMRGWQDGWPIRGLLAEATYLEATDPQTVAETLWRLLIDHGEPYLQPIITAAARNPTLRSLRPWISHGTLHLLHADDCVTGARLGLAFHPAGDDARYAVNIYDGLLTPMEDAASAVTRAAAAAASW
jgi:hypothetical protein